VLRTVSRPLQRITLAAVKVAKGAYGTEVDLRKSNDEIGLLANSFNEMSRKMAADIDELGRLNDQLIHAEKLAAMGTLAAGVAHEVNNPLASISSLVQMMRSQEGHSPETREKLKMIEVQITRITQVTKDMTNFARSRPAAKTDVDFNTVVKTALRLASFDKAFQELDITTDLADDLPTVFADEDQLQQVILNLLLNARDAVSAERGVRSAETRVRKVDVGTLNGESENSALRTPHSALGSPYDIRISSSLRSSDVLIEITDTGSGIEPVALGQIFDPFYTTKPAGRGTGLGLAVCYGIVTAHGGRIEVGDNTPTGTTFSVSLPIQPNSSRPN